MPKGQSKYRKTSNAKYEFKEGKWYSIDDLYEKLPAPVIRNMFRKPEMGETPPGRSKYGTEIDLDLSEWEMCLHSFAIRIVCNYNVSSEEVPL